MKRMFTVAVAAMGMCAPAMAQQSIEAKPSETMEGLPEFEQPEVWFGSKAPELKIAEFVKGDAVSSFENGRVYVVEFWATWCVPCVHAFPHLSELQEKYGDKVTVVGVNIWDRKRDRATGEFTESAGDHSERIKAFVDDQGDRMGYTVAIEAEDGMASGWMEAAGRNGIPSAFIVDGNGKIAWMGHPMTMDEPLEQILAGEYDTKAAAKEAADEIISQQWFNNVLQQISTGDAEAGYAMATKLVKGPWKDNAEILNSIAWVTLTNDRISVRDHEFSIMAAKRAAELTGWEDANVLDTLARAYYESGDAEEAFKVQTKAIEHLPEDHPGAAEFQTWLETYKEAAGG